jgi:hypothetical protein
MRIAIVGSAHYPTADAVHKKLDESGKNGGRSMIVAGAHDFCEWVYDFTFSKNVPVSRPFSKNVPVSRPRLSWLQRTVAGRSLTEAEARVALRACDVLVADWDGESREATQIACAEMLRLGLPFQV